jgi:hypothetical protein
LPLGSDRRAVAMAETLAGEGGKVKQRRTM